MSQLKLLGIFIFLCLSFCVGGCSTLTQSKFESGLDPHATNADSASKKSCRDRAVELARKNSSSDESSQISRLVDPNLKINGPRCDVSAHVLATHAEGSFRPVYSRKLKLAKLRLEAEEAQIKLMMESLLDQYGRHITDPNTKDTNFRILVYAHGGLVSHNAAVLSAEQLAPHMIADGFAPVFLAWNSPFPDAYFQRLCCVADGRGDTSMVFLRAPSRLFGDAVSGIARWPDNTIKQTGRFWSTFVARRFGVDNDNGDNGVDAFINAPDFRIEPIAESLGLTCSPYELRSGANLQAALGSIQCPRVDLPMFRSSGNERQQFQDINGYPQVTIGTLADIALTIPRGAFTVLTEPAAASWDAMIRRARLTTSSEFLISYVPSSEASNFKKTTDSLALRAPCVQSLERNPVDLSPRGDQNSYYKTSTPGTYYRFFERLNNCIKMGAFGSVQQRPQIWIFAHSMGTIVTNDLMRRLPDLPYYRAVYMGGAATITDSIDALNQGLFFNPTWNGPQQTNKAEFYNLMLHPIAESLETGGRALRAQTYTPRGTLLEWIDEYFETSRTPEERVVGKWRNVRAASQAFPSTQFDRVNFRVFPATSANKDASFFDAMACAQIDGVRNNIRRRCFPLSHGDFDDFTFWRAAYFEGAPQPQDNQGNWTVNRNFRGN
jgi:pimeloyl-ACP methyl ester carboxylesterase